MFDLPDPNSTESTTASESDMERLDQHPPSPRTASRNYLKKINELAAAKSRKRPVRSRLLDGDEDGERHLQSDVKATRETQLMDMLMEGGKEKDDDIGTGGMMLDWKMPGFRSNPAFAKYWEWQVERVAAMENDTPVLREVRLSNMGLLALLPGELRNRIYRLALLEKDGPFIIIGQPNQCTLGPCAHMKLSTAAPGILNTCRQIRHEAMPIFLAENTLKFDARTVRDRCTANFLRAIGPYGRFIRQVSLEIIVWVVAGRNLLQMSHPYEITIDCPSPHAPVFTMETDPAIRVPKRKVVVEQVVAHMAKLNELVEMERKERLLLEFVRSDLLADLVYQCNKHR